jgi:hypothetical protein
VDIQVLELEKLYELGDMIEGLNSYKKYIITDLSAPN